MRRRFKILRANTSWKRCRLVRQAASEFRARNRYTAIWIEQQISFVVWDSITLPDGSVSELDTQVSIKFLSSLHVFDHYRSDGELAAVVNQLIKPLDGTVRVVRSAQPFTQIPPEGPAVLTCPEGFGSRGPVKLNGTWQGNSTYQYSASGVYVSSEIVQINFGTFTIDHYLPSVLLNFQVIEPEEDLSLVFQQKKAQHIELTTGVCPEQGTPGCRSPPGRMKHEAANARSSLPRSTVTRDRTQA